MLADLICAADEDNFKLNLFPDQLSAASKTGAKGASEQDDNTITIDLGKQ